MPYAEILFISAKSGQRLNKIFEMIDIVIENNSMRVATGVLTRSLLRQWLCSSRLQTKENV